MASSRKRKPLADLTNEHDLIPTSLLRKLVAATSNPASLTKPPNSILRSTSRNQFSGSENTSIGSSNISATRASKTVGFRTPAKGHAVHKDGICHTRQAVQKSYKDIEAGSLNDVLSLEKRKEKGKKIVIHATLPPSTNKNVKESMTSNPFGSSGKEKQTPELYVSSFRGPVVRLKKLGDGNSNHASCSYQNTDKGKETLNDSIETEEIGKATEENSSCSIEKTYDRKKGFLKHFGSFIERSRAAKDILISPTLLDDKTKEKGKEILHAPDIEMAKKILISSPLLVDKTKEKGKAILHPPNKVEKTKNARDANDFPPQSNKIGKLDIHALTSSCPAVPRTKKCQSSDISDGGSSKSSKSWTGPDPKPRKKGSRLGGYSELPLEFVQQQKAYFEEVDAFDLQVEEASENESD